jgi:hypothetical protein
MLINPFITTDLANVTSTFREKQILPCRQVVSSLSKCILVSPSAVLRLNANPVIDGSLQPLLAAEVPFGSLDGHVTEQKLDLV